MEADLEAALALITKLRSERDDALQQSEESRQRQLELEEVRVFS